MNNSVLLIGNIMGSILQPLYTCLFILNTKKLKEKRISFIILTILDYILIQYSLSFNVGVNSDILFAIIMYLNLKLIYLDKARITDMVTFIISEIILGIVNICSYLILGETIIGLVFALIIPLLIVIAIKNKLGSIENFYNKYWNRKNGKTKIKSITVRGISLCITIIETLVLHFWIMYIISK